MPKTQKKEAEPQLKKSCDACTASKVKCSGIHPCDRCTKKGNTCCFSLRKRRSTKSKTEKQTLTPWEKKTWSVFFTLYKHYNTGICKFFFSTKLLNMLDTLQRQRNLPLYNKLSAWMEASGIQQDSLRSEHVQTYQELHHALRMLIVSRLKTAPPPLMDILPHKNQSDPHMQMITQTKWDPDDPSVKETTFTVECSDSFTQVFKITAADLNSQLRRSGGGFLPWNLDILSRIVADENELLNVLQIVAIKINAIGQPTMVPSSRSIPSAHVLGLLTSDQQYKTSLLKCLHTESVDDYLFQMKLFVQIQPLSVEMKESPPDLFPEKIEQPFTAFPLKKKRKISLSENFVISDEPGFDQGMRHLRQNSLSLSIMDESVGSCHDAATMSEGSGTQSEWLDELLKWAETEA